MKFTDQLLNIKFVQEVEKHEVLYNYNLAGYSRKDIVEAAWQAVADAVNLPVLECREKWRNVRTVFIRKMKPSPRGPKNRRKAYYLADAMKFCLPYVKILSPNPNNRKSSTDAEELSVKSEQMSFDENASLDDITEITQDEQDHEPILPQYFDSKDFHHNTANLIDSETMNYRAKIEKKEALKMFLLSLMPEVENFSDTQVKVFKRKIFSLIDDISGVPYSNDIMINPTMSGIPQI